MSDSVPLKRCPACPEDDQWHPATPEFFHRHKDGLAGRCKKCKLAYNKSYRSRPEVHEHSLAYNKAHYKVRGSRPEYREQQRVYHKEYQNRPGVRERTKGYWQAYKSRPNVQERLRAHRKAYKACPEVYVRYQSYGKDYYRRPGMRERTSEQKKAYYRRPEIRERRLAQSKAYHNSPEGRERYRINRHIRRTRKTQAGGSYTVAQWHALKAQYNYTCLCCHKQEPEIKLTADHIVPVFKGGSSYIWNIQPLCKSCNTSKGTKIIDYRLTIDTPKPRHVTLRLWEESAS